MGKLINRQRRDQARHQREERKTRIREAAADAFLRFPFAEVTLELVGRLAKVKQGLPSLYFGSKEELLLQLISRELKHWLAEVEQTDDQPNDRYTHSTLIARLVDSLVSNPATTRLFSLIPIALEHTKDPEAAISFLHGFETSLDRTGSMLQHRCPELPPDMGSRLLHRLVLASVGICSWARQYTAEGVVLRVDQQRELCLMLEGLLSHTHAHTHEHA